MKQFDLVIVGGGTAGVSAARFAGDAGARVCLVEQNRVGGHALFRGIFPLLGALKRSPEPSRDLSGMFEDISNMARSASENLVQNLEQSGVTIITGRGSLGGRNQIRIDTPEGEKTVAADKIILATGSLPKPMPNLPFDERDVLSEDQVLEFRQCPESLLIVGTEVNAILVARVFKHFGSKVFYCQETDRLLPGLEPEIAGLLEQNLKARKIKLLLGKKITSIFRSSNQVDITLEGGVKFVTEKILLVGERLGNSLNLGLDSLKIELGGDQAVWVNETMETSAPGVYAAGSITGRPHSFDTSEAEGKATASNALGKSKPLLRDAIPLRILSEPEIAIVGCSARDAHHKGYRAVEGCSEEDVLVQDLLADEHQLICKLVVDRESRKIIGAQIAGAGASELMDVILLSMQKGITVQALSQMPCGFLSRNRALRDAARACVRALSGKA